MSYIDYGGEGYPGDNPVKRPQMTDPSIISLALQESNDIESHDAHKVNGASDLEDSLLAWKFLCDTENKLGNYRLPLTLDRVCTTHWLITHNQMPEDERGVMRSTNGQQVMIGGRVGAKPSTVYDLMLQWLRDMPVVDPKASHITFEHIHPFSDGNGRTGRMIYYWQLMQQGELTEAAIIRDSEREQYYAWF